MNSTPPKINHIQIIIIHHNHIMVKDFPKTQNQIRREPITMLYHRLRHLDQILVLKIILKQTEIMGC